MLFTDVSKPLAGEWRLRLFATFKKPSEKVTLRKLYVVVMICITCSRESVIFCYGKMGENIKTNLLVSTIIMYE